MRRCITYFCRCWVFILVLAGGHAMATELVISAAASLTEAFKDIAKEFEATRPEVKVMFNFASSDVLLSQIANGAPVDVFASADQDTVDKGAAQGLWLSASRSNFAQNRLVLIAPANSNVRLSGLTDLDTPAVKRIAMGQPTTVPAGRYTKEALEAAKLWRNLESKLIFAQNVRQALTYVVRGDVDAGFVYVTDAAIVKDKVRVLTEVPVKNPILYPIVVVKDSKQQDFAQQFVRFVTGDTGQRMHSKYGFAQLEM